MAVSFSCLLGLAHFNLPPTLFTSPYPHLCCCVFKTPCQAEIMHPLHQPFFAQLRHGSVSKMILETMMRNTRKQYIKYTQIKAQPPKHWLLTLRPGHTTTRPPRHLTWAQVPSSQAGYMVGVGGVEGDGIPSEASLWNPMQVS